MKKSHTPPVGSTHTQKAPGRPSSLTPTEEQRYVTLRNWDFSQREAGALARNLPRGRNGTRPPLSASTRQRLDTIHGPFTETLKLPSGHSADSLRKLPERALVALADARSDVSNRKYQEAAGLRTVVKPAQHAKKQPLAVSKSPAQAKPHPAPPKESITYQAWHRASSVLNAFYSAPTDTDAERLAYVRMWCIEWSFPVELDADARRHLTPWEQIAATWDGEFIADAARKTLLLPFRDEVHPKITSASREAILSARSALQSERPQSSRKFNLPPFDPEATDEWPDDMGHY
jgi:hypothetical protein